MKPKNLEKNQMLSMYEKMYRIREFESKVFELYTQGAMPGLAHLYIGEEAVATGACMALKPKDYIVSTHRGHGHLIARGASTDRMMAEILGKKDGYCNGKGGSMHIVDVEKGILGANGIVGGGIPIATGAADASKLKKTGQVALSFFGDAASNQGTFHESINMASAWKLPVVYVIENNLYGISVALERVVNVKDLSVRAKGYGINGVTVDGNNVLDVYAAVQQAVDLAREGGGPSIIECKTYRQKGHHSGDPATSYRTKDEEATWKARDPIPNFRQYLLDQKVATEQEVKDIETLITDEIAAATTFALNSPFPDESEAYTDIYAE